MISHLTWKLIWVANTLSIQIYITIHNYRIVKSAEDSFLTVT